MKNSVNLSGSACKKGLKERIKLIAKKPKMSVIALIVFILIAAAAICITFTLASKENVTGSIGSAAYVDNAKMINCRRMRTQLLVICLMKY